MESDVDVRNAGEQLLNRSLPLSARFRALFLLRNINGRDSIDWIVKAFSDSSDLLKHELAYCLGQMNNIYALDALSSVLSDEKQAAIVRHEAAEAIGAIGDPKGTKMLEPYLQSQIPELAETCQLAVRRIAWCNDVNEKEDCLVQNQFGSIDPTPCYACENTDASLKAMEQLFLDEKAQLWDRYRAMFSLRNMASANAASSLTKGLFCPNSALFRHEVAFVLGQLSTPIAVESLKKVLADTEESGMVRHECAEALGSIATEDCKQILRRFLSDSEPLVSESCEVALDVCDYMVGSEFQYAATLS
uniref:Deoxyhypusine hydroxylase n=1 Tax=Trichuris muris TaxID=70415 RepID=A0A5S6QQK4_TRIMR